MRLIALKNVFVETNFDYEQGVVVLMAGTWEYPILRSQDEHRLIFMHEGDTIYFTHIASGDNPYQTLADRYPEFFQFEKEEHNGRQIDNNRSR